VSRTPPFHPGPYKIPEISDGQLRERAAMVQLVHRRIEYITVREEGEPVGFQVRSLGLWWIEKPDDLRCGYTWSPTWIRPVEDGEIVAAKTALTLHPFRSRSIFRASLAEVLAFAPANLHEYAAVSLQGPDDADDLNANLPALHACFHVAEATYYRSAS
jgi:hypothetical protein